MCRRGRRAKWRPRGRQSGTFSTKDKLCRSTYSYRNWKVALSWFVPRVVAACLLPPQYLVYPVLWCWNRNVTCVNRFLYFCRSHKDRIRRKVKNTMGREQPSTTLPPPTSYIPLIPLLKFQTLKTEVLRHVAVPFLFLQCRALKRCLLGKNGAKLCLSQILFYPNASALCRQIFYNWKRRLFSLDRENFISA